MSDKYESENRDKKKPPIFFLDLQVFEKKL